MSSLQLPGKASKHLQPTQAFWYRRTEIHPRNSAAFQGQSPWQGQEISAANVRQSCGCNNALPSAAPHPPNPLSAFELEEPGLFVIPRSHARARCPTYLTLSRRFVNATGTKPPNAQSSRGDVKRAEQQRWVLASPNAVERWQNGEGTPEESRRAAVPYAHCTRQAGLNVGEAAGSQGLLKPTADTRVWVALQTIPCCQVQAPVARHSWRREKKTSTTATFVDFLPDSGISLNEKRHFVLLGSPRLHF